MVERVSFDTNIIWHGLLPSTNAAAPVCRRLMAAVDDGEIEVWCSTLVLVELPKVLAPQMPIERIVALTETLRASPINWVPLTRRVALLAREIGLEDGLAPAYDATIIATAVEVGVTTLMSENSDDFPVGRSVRGVTISEPFLPGHLAQGRLDV
ncbi:MAG: PIN domain-containing protein [Actinomycetes bacterium]